MRHRYATVQPFSTSSARFSKTTNTVVGTVVLCLVLLYVRNASTSEQQQHGGLRNQQQKFLNKYGPVYQPHGQLNFANADLRFLAVGDWGIGRDDPLREKEIPLQEGVSHSLEQWAVQTNTEFILSLGDQVYPHGVRDHTDTRLLDIFSSFAVGALGQAEWLATLGNHDCEGDPNAMMEMGAKLIDRQIKARRNHVAGINYVLNTEPQKSVTATAAGAAWRLGNDGGNKGYYFVEKTISSKTSLGLFDTLRVVVLNSCTLVCSTEVRNFRCDPSKNDRGELVGGLPHFATPEYKLQRNEQLVWLRETLALPKPVGSGKLWKVVVSHWPMYSFRGNGPTGALQEVVLPLLQEFNVHVFLNGHDHSVQHITTTAVRTHFFGSGAGGFKIHTFLKESADNTLNDGATLQSVMDEHGFLAFSVNQGDDKMMVGFVRGANGELVHTAKVDWY